MTDPALALALLVLFAVGAQLLAHAAAVPQIVTLLAIGVAVGPDALGIIDTDELLGSTLEPS
jgi:NhaP-type Na+/H+ or K+/H+ antiporter